MWLQQDEIGNCRSSQFSLVICKFVSNVLITIMVFRFDYLLLFPKVIRAFHLCTESNFYDVAEIVNYHGTPLHSQQIISILWKVVHLRKQPQIFICI
jgi:hypothetical protein